MPLKDTLIFLLKTLGIIIVLTLTIINLNIHFQPPKKIPSQVSNYQKELDYWKNFTQQNPTYRDAYIRIAELEYKLGNTNKAQHTIQTAKNISPNLDKIHLIQKVLGVKTP